MRLIGYCTSCHRIGYVRVGSSGMTSLAVNKIATGICRDCEEKEQLRQVRP